MPVINLMPVLHLTQSVKMVNAYAGVIIMIAMELSKTGAHVDQVSRHFHMVTFVPSNRFIHVLISRTPSAKSRYIVRKKTTSISLIHSVAKHLFFSYNLQPYVCIFTI